MTMKTGIWIDSDIAYLLKIDKDGKEYFSTIESSVEHFHPHGGYGASQKHKPQDAISESKLLERSKHQLKDFFLEIINSLKDIDQLVVFGPAEAKTEFKKELENHPEIGDKLISVNTADSMTLNQTKALIRDFYKER